MPQATTGLQGALDALLNRQLRERQRDDELAAAEAERAQEEARLALSARQVAATEEQQAFLQQLQLAGLIQPGQQVDPGVLEGLGAAGQLKAPGGVGQVPFRPPVLQNVPGVGILDVDPNAGTAETLFETPETFDEPITGRPSKDDPFGLFQIGSRGTVRPTGLEPRPPEMSPSVLSATIRAGSQASSTQARQAIAEAANQTRLLITAMQQGSANDRTAASVQAQNLRAQLAGLQNQARISAGFTAPNIFGMGGTDPQAQEAIEAAQALIDQLDAAITLPAVTVPSLGAGGGPGVVTPGAAPAPSPRETPQQRIERLTREATGQ